MDEDKNALLEKYISEQEKILQKKKEEELISRGLYRLETSDEYQPYFTYDPDKKIYYKKVPLELTDEEYEQIKKYPVKRKSDLGLASVLILIGVIIIVLGVVFGIAGSNGDGGTAMLVIIGTFASGIVYIALGVIINLLSEIKNDINR